MRCTHSAFFSPLFFLGISSSFFYSEIYINSIFVVCDDVVLNIHLYKEIMEKEKREKRKKNDIMRLFR